MTWTEKLEDCAVINQLTRRHAGRVSLHFPWDKPSDPTALLPAGATIWAWAFDAVNSNTFQDQAGQAHTYKFGSLTSTNKPPPASWRSSTTSTASSWARQLGSKGLTVWVGDGANFPGQSNLRGALERYIDSMPAASTPRCPTTG